MADTKISALPAATAPTGVEVAPVVQGGATVKMSVSQIATYAYPAPNYISGNWYYLHGTAALAAGTVFNTAGSVAYTPVLISSPVSIAALAVRVSTVFAGGLAAAAIYANNPATNQPMGAPLGSVTGLSTATATTVSATLASPLVLAPGLYWAAVQCDNVTAAFSCPSNTSPFPGSALGSASLATVNPSATNVGPQYYTQNSTYPTLPTPTAGTITPNNGNRCGALFIQVT